MIPCSFVTVAMDNWQTADLNTPHGSLTGQTEPNKPERERVEREVKRADGETRSELKKLNWAESYPSTRRQQAPEKVL